MISSAGSAVTWPPKHNLFGVQISACYLRRCHRCDYPRGSPGRTRRGIGIRRACARRSFHGSGVHREGEPFCDHHTRRPAGALVAELALRRARLERNVRGSELMWRLCERAAEEDVSIYLYGSSPETLAALKANLLNAFPDLVVAGCESPPFRPLSAAEDAEMVERVNASGAGLMFLGLGCPKQDHFAAEHADRIRAVQLCVGAAFDFHAGTKPTAPEWMQRRGLEWIFRLYQEPKRLWRRYLVTNSIFLRKLASQFIRQRVLGIRQ